MIAERIARFIIGITPGKIPAKAFEIARRGIADFTGVALAGSKEEAGGIIAGLVREMGGVARSGVIGSGFGTAPQLAALANGTMGHALDYDDLSFTYGAHPSVTLAPAVLSLGEDIGASGQEVLAAYVDRPFYQLAWELLRWFDYWLKGIDTGIMDEPLVRIFLTGANEWLSAPDFPVPGTKYIPFNLHENRSLCEIEPWPEAAAASYDDSPAARGSLKYYSAPMVENTEVVGLASLNLYASCRGTDMNIFASLWEADPENKETCLAWGYLKASHRELDLKLSKPWHPVPRHTDPQPVMPGQVYQLSLGFSPLSHLFKAGQRTVLKLSSADDDPENLFQVGMYHLCSQTPNTITIYHDAHYPSHLLLPITRGNIIGTYVSGGDISLKTKGFMELK